MKVFTLFQKKDLQESLLTCDTLYKNTVKDLPNEARLHYCRNLIDCCKDDLLTTKDTRKRKELNSLISASEKEISTMK